MATVIDELIARFRFEANRGDVQAIERGLENVRKGARAAGTAFIAMGAALAGISAIAITTFAGIETKLATMQGLVGISAEQLEEWLPLMSRISVATGQTMDDIADAMFFITSAGLRGTDALNTLEAAARASTAGVGDMTELAKISTQIMNAYGVENITAAQALDAIAKAAELGAADTSDYAAQAGNLIPLMQSFGIEAEQVLGMMASMSLVSSNTSTNVANLRQVFQLLLKPTAQAKKNLDELGISVDHLRNIADTQGPIEVLNYLKEAVGGNTLALSQFFEGSEAMLGVMTLVGGNAANTERIMAEMGNTTGKVDEAFDIMAQTLNVKVSRAVAGFQALVIALGAEMSGSLQGPLDQVIIELEYLNSALQNADPWIKRLIAFTPVLAVGLIVVGAALHGLAFALGPLGKLLIGTIHLFTTFARAMANVILTAIRMAVMLVGAAARGIFTVARAALLGTGAITKLRIALLRLGIAANLSSIMMRIALIPAILRGVIPAFTAMARAAWASLGPYLPIVLGVIVAINALLVALGYVVQNWDKITKAAGSAWQMVIDGLGMILEVGEPIVTAFANLWLNQLTFIGNAFKTWLDLVLSGLSSLVGAMDWVSGKLGLDLGLGDVKNKIDEIRTAVGEFDVGEFVGNIPEHIKNLATAAVQEIGKGIEAAAGAASTAVQPVINIVQDVAAAHQTGREALSGLLPNMDAVLGGAPLGLPVAPAGAAGKTGHEALSELLPNMDAVLGGAPFGLPVAPEGAAAMMRGGAGGQSMLGDADRALLQEIRDAIRDEQELAGQRGIQINELRVDVSAVGNPRDIGRNVATDLTDQFEALGFDLEGNIAR